MTELKTQCAIEYLGLQGRWPYALKPLPKRKAKSFGGKPPWLYSTEHLNRVATLMREAQLSLPAACRVVAAEVEGRV